MQTKRQLPPTKPHDGLKRKLLSLGGSGVIWQGSDPHAALIAARGQLFTQPVRKRRGEPHRCHANAAELWASVENKYQLVTGYALSKNQQWVSHSWVIDDKNLYETAHQFTRYFGVVLPQLWACKFWFENCESDHPHLAQAPVEFWLQRPGLLAAIEVFAQMPKEKVFQSMKDQVGNVCA